MWLILIMVAIELVALIYAEICEMVEQRRNAAAVKAKKQELETVIALIQEHSQHQAEPDIDCIICLDEPRTIVLDCGHLCLCVDCSDSLEECPICRTPIATRTQVVNSPLCAEELDDEIAVHFRDES